MIGHIQLYGEFINEQHEDAGKYGFITLSNVMKQITAQPNATEYEVHIHSIGGDVEEGLAIYNALLSTGKKITTINDGVCYSIATIPYMAGSVRKSNNNAKFRIHNAWGFAMGDAKELRERADEFDLAVKEIINIYIKNGVNKTIEELEAILSEDRQMETSEAKKINLVTEVTEPLKAVAKFNQKREINSKKNKMGKKNKTLFDKFQAWLKDNDETSKKNLIVKTADQTEIDFYELKDDATPKIGDKAKIDGESAKGSHVLQDKTTYIFIDGELTEIKEDESNDEIEALQAKIDALEADKIALQNKVDKNKDKYVRKKTELKEVQEKFDSLKNLFSDVIVDDKGRQSKRVNKGSSKMGAYIKNIKNIKNKK